MKERGEKESGEKEKRKGKRKQREGERNEKTKKDRIDNRKGGRMRPHGSKLGRREGKR